MTIYIAVDPTRPRVWRPKMNEFLTSYSSDQTLLWALLIIGVVAVAAISLHLFWTGVFRAVAALLDPRSKTPGDAD
jgi:hypothetical protein